MTNEELVEKLNSWADRLVPVAGLLMQVACSNGRCAREPEIHEKDCECRVCLAFLGVHKIQSEMEEAIRGLS